MIDDQNALIGSACFRQFLPKNNVNLLTKRHAQITIQQPMQKASKMTLENLDHQGLVAGLVDDLGIVQKINELVGKQPGQIVSPRLVVKAMIITGLGLAAAPLYLFYNFFEGKAIEHLLGERDLSITSK
jgi:hypothetical protein